MQRQMLYGVGRLFQSAEFGADGADAACGEALRMEANGIGNALEADIFLLKQEAEIHARHLLRKL